MGKLFEELKRRRVFRVAAMYLVVTWLVIQVADVVIPALRLPEWTLTFITVLFMLGFPIAIVLSWAYDITPDGIRPDDPDLRSDTAAQPGNQELIYAILALVLIVVGFQVADRMPANQSDVEISRIPLVEEGLPPPVTYVDIVTPPTASTANFALSPDGTKIVFVASGDNSGSRLWLRSLASPVAQPLVGTEGALTPFWSPDSRSIAFLTDNALKRTDLGGGDPQKLAHADFPRGGSWGIDDVILFSANPTGPLMQVPATGGESTVATELEEDQLNHRNPFFLPDGRQYLFYVQGSPSTAGIYLGNLDGEVPVRLTTATSAGVYHPDGWLMWLRAGKLSAQRLALDQAVLTGEQISLADGVAENRANHISALSVSGNGLIAYRRGSASLRQLIHFDEAGRQLGTVGEPDGVIYAPRRSPSDERVVVYRNLHGNIDVWLMDGTRKSRFTFNPGMDVFPLWSPDGSQIAFHSNRSGKGDLYKKSSSGTGKESLIVSSDLLKWPSSWSPDGRHLVYMVSTPEASTDLWAVSVTGDEAPFEVLQTPFDERWPTISPDNRWIAYHSNESGKNMVYVRAFITPDTEIDPTLDGVWQISVAGGTFATWGPDGEKLYYLSPVGELLVSQFNATNVSVEVGAPKKLFATKIYGGGLDNGLGPQYDVTPQGGFLINTVVGEGATYPITLIQDWNPDQG